MPALINTALESVVSLAVLAHAQRALADAPTPARRAPLARFDWGHAHAQVGSTTVRRWGSPQRRLALGAALCPLAVWTTYLGMRRLIDGVLGWTVPFYSSLKTLWLVWMLMNMHSASAAVFVRTVYPLMSRNEDTIDAALLWAEGLLIVCWDAARWATPDAVKARGAQAAALVLRILRWMHASAERAPPAQPPPVSTPKVPGHMPKSPEKRMRRSMRLAGDTPTRGPSGAGQEWREPRRARQGPASETPESGQEPRPKLESQLEPKLGPKPEPRLESKLEPRLEPVQEPKQEPKLEPKLDPMQMPSPQPRRQPKRTREEHSTTDSKRARPAPHASAKRAAPEAESALLKRRRAAGSAAPPDTRSRLPVRRSARTRSRASRTDHD